MGWREVLTNGTSSMVVEASTGFTYDRITAQARENLLEDLVEDPSLTEMDGELYCLGPWDNSNLYYRLTQSKINEECSMDEYIEYVSSLAEFLPRAYKSFRYFRRSQHASYVVERYKPSCPSLTDGSTVSEESRSSTSNELIPPFGRVSGDSIGTRLELAETTQNDSSNDVDLRMAFAKPRSLEIRSSPNEKIEQEGDISSPALNRVELTAVDGPWVNLAAIQTRPYGLDDSDLFEPETPTDTSSEDGDEDENDPFEALHRAIRQAFSSNTQLADKIIRCLDQLPPDRRAQVYDYRGIPSCANNDSQNSGNSVSCDNSTGPRKRKRIDTSPSSGSIGNHVHEDDDGENQVLVERRPSVTPSPPKRFACGYNVSNRARYGPRNNRSATQYKSCAGPGFKSLNHYKRHLERVHTLHQCPRCSRVFEALGELHAHLVQDQRCNVILFEREGMSQETWDEVKKIFKRDRRGQTGPTDEERWFLAWEALFPGKPRPPSAYYDEQLEHIFYPVVFVRIQEIFGASLSDMPQIDPTLHEELMGRLGNAIDAANRSAPSELEAIDLNAPLASVQVPTLSNAQNHTIGIEQLSHIEANSSNPTAVEPTHWGAIDSVGEPNHLGNGVVDEPFGDMLDLSLFDAGIVSAGKCPLRTRHVFPKILTISLDAQENYP
ncbi:hypothetical protein F5Y06DRAFT_280764 [Hypoxylon sp. FL0890]|nr:hypothetical protein F5Y06DRAFT_280764 [Hypoxylon sp. FL0890]